MWGSSQEICSWTWGFIPGGVILDLEVRPGRCEPGCGIYPGRCGPGLGVHLEGLVLPFALLFPG